jgi:hypothetical protein
MLRIFCLNVFVLISITSFSQNTKKVTATSPQPPALKPAAPKILKDLRDSASYTAGIHIVNKYRSANIYNFNSAVVGKCINDLQTGKPQLISNSDADNAVSAYQNKLMTNSNSKHYIK